MNFKALKNGHPSHYIHRFEVWRRQNKRSATGRVEKGSEEKTELTVRDGILAEASIQTRQAWEGNQHPITHTIVSYDRPPGQIVEKDLLVMQGGKRKFQVQGLENPGGNGMYTIYYVLERKDTYGS